jgi:multidrug resistance efflux pump
MDDLNKGKMTRSRGFWRIIATLAITAVGIFAGVQLWQRYMLTPCTRDGPGRREFGNDRLGGERSYC